MFSIFDLKQPSAAVQPKSPPSFTTSFNVILLLTNYAKTLDNCSVESWS